MPEVGEAVESRVHGHAQPQQHYRREPVVHQAHGPHRQTTDSANLDVRVEGIFSYVHFKSGN